jgi:hypothetical protein
MGAMILPTLHCPKFSLPELIKGPPHSFSNIMCSQSQKQQKCIRRTFVLQHVVWCIMPATRRPESCHVSSPGPLVEEPRRLLLIPAGEAVGRLGVKVPPGVDVLGQERVRPGKLLCPRRVARALRICASEVSFGDITPSVNQRRFKV